MHLLNRFLTAFVCERDPDKKDYAIGIVPMIGIGFHSFIDGFVYSIAFSVSILTGYLATLGMVLHEFPEGIITYLLLVRGGVTERKVLMLAFLAAAATTPLGMLVSDPLISAIERPTLGALLAVSAGALVYVGATHLLPRAEQEQRRFSLVALARGVLVAVILVLLKWTPAGEAPVSVTGRERFVGRGTAGDRYQDGRVTAFRALGGRSWPTAEQPASTVLGPL